MKKVLITAPTIIGGVFYEPSHLPQSAPDDVAEHLCSIGNARPYEEKIVQPVEKKTAQSSASPPAPASRKRIVRKRK